MRATGSLPAQPDLSWPTWTDPARGQRKSLQPTRSGKEKEIFKKESSCYLASWIPLSTAMWSSPGFPSLEGAPGGQAAPREKVEKDTYASRKQEKSITQQRGE